MGEQHSLGAASMRHLEGVEQELVDVVTIALRLCLIDFSVVDGNRTEEEQRQNILDGVSWTMESKHLVGRAVDIYPYVNGRTSHNPYHYKLIARAMFEAAAILGVRIRWGGLWRETRLDLPHWALAELLTTNYSV